jgi:hypothetical protein
VFRRFAGPVGRHSVCRAILLAHIAILPPAAAYANGFGESRPWQFDSSADKTNKAFVLDVREKKRGGFYDSFAPASVTNNSTTNVAGDLVNCSVAPQATGNLHSASMQAQTSSPTFSSTVGATTTGNTASNENGKEGTLNNNQTNSGSTLNSSVSGTSVSNGPTDASGGTTSQVLNNSQTNTGNQSASVSNSQGCVFNKK